MTVKEPHKAIVAVAEYVADQRGVDEKAGFRTEVVNGGWAVAEIVTVSQGLTNLYS